MNRLKCVLSVMLTVGVVSLSYGQSQKPAFCPGTSGVKESAKFVYCGPSVCTPTKDGSKAICNDCYTMVGENFGTTSCEERAPKENKWVSSFSARKAAKTGALEQPVIFCSANEGADTSYADCLNAPCKITNTKTGQAECECNIVHMKEKSKSYVTQARSCETANKCNAPKGYILNGAPTPAVLPLIEAISKETNQTINQLTCSTASAVAKNSKEGSKT